MAGYIPGLDVYSGYGVIDWGAVASAGYRFAIIKCAEGNEPARNDGMFRRNVAGCKAAGIYVGGYFFPYPLHEDGVHTGRSPVEQAERFFTLAQGLGMHPGELPPVVDAEWPEIGEWGKWGCSAQQISTWLQEHCERVEQLWGRKPIIYSYPFWWRAVSSSADVAWAAEYPLWIANYTHAGAGMPPETLKPIVPAPWDDWLLWQHSAKGSLARVPGIEACPVDRNVFAGSLDDLRRLALIDPDADTLPELVPVVRPDPLEARTVVDFPIVHKSPFGDEPPDNAA